MEYVPDYCAKRVLILGCGNVLFGDDGFGPEVAQKLLADYELPEDVYVLDTGTGVREILFDMVIGGHRPEKIVIVDAMDVGKPAGELFELPLDNIPANKTDDFSLHQVPTSNLLKELRDLCGVEIRIIACQTGYIPKEVTQGLSEPMQKAVPKACEMILDYELKNKN